MTPFIQRALALGDNIPLMIARASGGWRCVAILLCLCILMALAISWGVCLFDDQARIHVWGEGLAPWLGGMTPTQRLGWASLGFVLGMSACLLVLPMLWRGLMRAFRLESALETQLASVRAARGAALEREALGREALRAPARRSKPRL